MFSHFPQLLECKTCEAVQTGADPMQGGSRVVRLWSISQLHWQMPSTASSPNSSPTKRRCHMLSFDFLFSALKAVSFHSCIPIALWALQITFEAFRPTRQSIIAASTTPFAPSSKKHQICLTRRNNTESQACFDSKNDHCPAVPVGAHQCHQEKSQGTDPIPSRVMRRWKTSLTSFIASFAK